MYIGNDWGKYLKEEYNKPYFKYLMEKVELAYVTQTILPDRENVFKAFKYTDFNEVKCVILGQDPYPTIGVPCGLSFSVNLEANIPQSLKNIFKELTNDTGITYPAHGNLTAWAEQGVLMLNSTLTVEAGNSDSHRHIGWQTFTDVAIKELSDNREDIVFLLWGRYAQSKHYLIDNTKHLILQTSHPSPHSASLGFLGCNHFSKVNQYLVSVNKETIDWKIE